MNISRGRVRIWKDQAEPYLKVVAEKNIWRLEGLGYTQDDFINQAFFTYEKCINKYGTVLNSKGKLSPKFRVSVNNLVMDLSKEATNQISFLERGLSIEDVIRESYLDNSNYGYFQVLLREAPIEVKQVISLVFNTPLELLVEIKSMASKRNSQTFNSNKFLCRMLGYSEYKIDFVSILKKYFN